MGPPLSGKDQCHGRIARRFSRQARSLSPFCTWPWVFATRKEKDQCSISIVKNSIGPGASSCSKPAASPARRMAPCSPPMAKPPSSPPSYPPRRRSPGVDFFPLTVNYQEKAFAAGRIPGGYFKREGRPSEKETLVSRLIDRPIRPLFPDGYRNDTQVIVTVLSHDLENDPDILSMVAASAALTLSGIPFMGPVGGARVGYINGQLKVNPTIEEMKDFALDLVVAGTGEAVLMVESEAKELSEETMLAAVMAGHQRLPAGYRRDHSSRRKGGEGAARTRSSPTRPRSRRRSRQSPKRSCARPTRSPPRRNAITRSMR